MTGRRPTRDKRWPSINFQLPPELLARLNAVCDRRLVGRTLVIQTAITEIVSRLEAEESQHDRQHAQAHEHRNDDHEPA